MLFASSGGSFLACSLGLRHPSFVGPAAPTGVCATVRVFEFGRLVPRLLTRASPSGFRRVRCSDWRLRSVGMVPGSCYVFPFPVSVAVRAFAGRHRHASVGSLVSAGDHDVGVDSIDTGSKFFEVGGDAVEC